MMGFTRGMIKIHQTCHMPLKSARCWLWITFCSFLFCFLCFYLLTVLSLSFYFELQISKRRSKDSSLGESSKCKSWGSITKAWGISTESSICPVFFVGFASILCLHLSMISLHTIGKKYTLLRLFISLRRTRNFCVELPFSVILMSSF